MNMSSVMTTFVVLGPHGRRYTIKVSPNTSMLQVLEEACRKHGINPNDYDLKHYNTSLDLSLSVCFANLPNNSMLELHPTKEIRQESIVTVGLQLESGDRITRNFTPSATVWDVVSNCLTNREDYPRNEDISTALPSCVYMRQMISQDEMRQVTLRSLGLTSGKAMFRLIYRQSFELQQQAHVTTPLKNSVIDPVVSDNKEKCINIQDPGCSDRKRVCLDLLHKEDSTENVGHTITHEMSEKICFNCDLEESFKIKDVDHSPISPCDTSIIKQELIQPVVCVSNTQLITEDLMEVDASLETGTYENLPIEEKGSVKILGEKNAILFSLDDITVIPRTELSDEFFELTIQDIRYLMEEYKRVRMELESKPLELATQKENKSLQQLALYTQCVIRIYFPDRLVLQGIFSVEETIYSIIEFIRSFLEDKELDFYLYTSPPKVKLPKDKSLFECNLLPAAVVYFGCDKNLNNYILPHIKCQVSDPGAAYKAAAESRSKGFSAICTIKEHYASSTDTDRA